MAEVTTVRSIATTPRPSIVNSFLTRNNVYKLEDLNSCESGT